MMNGSAVFLFSTGGRACPRDRDILTLRMVENQSGGLEGEIAQIERALEEKRRELASRHASGSIEEIPHDKEVLREIVGEQLTQGNNASVPVAPSPAPTSPNTGASTVIPPAFKSALQELVNIAFTESINDAITRVRATGNAALIDAFHDIVVDQLYDTLVERGKIKRFK